MVCGRKRLFRVMKYSWDASQDFLEMAKADSEFGGKRKFLLPVIAEEKDKMMEKFDFDDSESSLIAGIMLFGGQTMGLAAKHEAVREIKQSALFQDTEMVLALHRNQTSPAEILVLSLAGVDIFQTDYALEAALEGKALMLTPTLADGSNQDAIASLLAKYKVQNTLLKNDPTLAIAICAEQLNPRDPKILLDFNALSEAEAEELKWSEAPIQPKCDCYTCLNYSRSYLYHLMEVKEMNLNILLAIHNMRVMDALFKEIQSQRQ